jgi:DNA-binding MarR family transcriptional regulator
VDIEPLETAPADALTAWRALLLAHSAALRAVAEEVRLRGRVSLSWYDVLLELDSAKEGLRMRDLADRVVLSRTRVSRLVDELVRAGLARKTPDPADGRVFHASITAEGRAALRETAPVYRAATERHFGAHLDEQDQAVLTRTLLKVAKAHGRA